MAENKVSVSFEVNSDSAEMLARIVDQYKLPDNSKAIRCLLDYVAEDGDWDAIFGKVRCLRC